MIQIVPTLKYLWLTIKHKYFVFLAGLKVKAPLWRLITHDLSKFRLSELPHYGRQFFGDADDARGFILCWIRHQNRNDHHPEWWIPRTGHNRSEPPYPGGCPVEMSRGASAELVADWLGAGRAFDGKWPDPDNWEWLDNNFDKIELHPNTRIMVLDIINSLKK